MRAPVLLGLCTFSAAEQGFVATPSSLSIEIWLGDRPVALEAALNQESQLIAEAFCHAHNLTSTEDGQACASAVEAEVLREYHRLEAIVDYKQDHDELNVVDFGAARFSHIRRQALLPPRLRFRPERDDPSEIARRLEGLYGMAPSGEAIMAASHGLYVPIQLEGVSGANMEGHGKVTPPGPSLSLHVDLEWSPGVLRRFVVYPGQEIVDAAIAFCARHRCPDRLNQIDQIVASIEAHQSHQSSTTSFNTPPPTRVRVMVSMSTLPSRLRHVPLRIAELKSQTHAVDHIYLCLPRWSVRERAPYEPVPQAILDDPMVTILWSQMDWGPATKLIPVLDVERDPRTMVITVDDDMQYPRTTVADLVENSRRLPNAVLGYLGLHLPRQEHVAMRHENFVYVEGCNETSDQLVDVLGGVGAVLYRVGFLDRLRLTDYIHYPSVAFYVDDEWIAGALEEAGVPRVVLSRDNAPATACPLMEGTNVLSYGREGSALNGPSHAHRNMEFQAMHLRYLREREGLWPSVAGPVSKFSFVDQVFMPEYYPLLGTRANSFRYMFEWLEALGGGGGYQYTIIETGTISDLGASRWSFSGQATLLFDRFLNHFQGKLYSVDLDEQACRVARLLTSRSRTVVLQGDSVDVLWKLPLDEGTKVDLVYLDSYDVDAGSLEQDQASAEHHLKELAAILPRTRMHETDGPGTLIVVDDNLQLEFQDGGIKGQLPAMRGKGRLVQELLHGRCREAFRGWQVGWVCGGSAGRL